MSAERVAGTIEASGLYEGLSGEVVTRLAKVPEFTDYAETMCLPAAARIESLLSTHEVRTLHTGVYFLASEAAYPISREVGGHGFERAAELLRLAKEESLSGALLKLHTLLSIDLAMNSGRGYDVETLARFFIRPPQWGVGREVPEGAVGVYVRSPGNICFYPQNRFARDWGAEEWASELGKADWDLKDEDTRLVIYDLNVGAQPYVALTGDFDLGEMYPSKAAWGVELRALDKAGILSLADGYLCGDCRAYHGDVALYKELSELIAPIGPMLFSGLVDTYKVWKWDHLSGGHPREGGSGMEQRFRVLVPAQADEKTAIGVIYHLVNNGIPLQEIKSNFDFVFGDLCVTPLLKVYAAMKEFGLLPISNIVSMDAFLWNDPMEEKFNFVVVDHLVDLFPSEQQGALMSSLIGALADGGRLVLTARCGTRVKITKEDVLNGFYSRVDLHVNRLLEILEEKSTFEESISYGGLEFNSRYEVARALFALLQYRREREVYPIGDIPGLEALLAGVRDRFGVNSDYNVIGENDVRVWFQKD